ncbi:TetR/AcrR family transcriptional regulator [Leucobacter allii]|uniref:TetR family transcriptional regulator n=1 Tax=Leucobacter allii TaxID=2932247 RepID=UPI001FD5DBA6|nr:TetR family transcriptional regulator [Leucobacter allii]UOR01316.1 TetR/AcrR family transcriptional regulator [Leucobacter allii]
MTTAAIRRPVRTASGEQRRTEILEAAARLFNRLGYHRTTTAAIAAEAGTAKGTVYHHFQAKHEILSEIHSAWIEELIERFQQLRAGTDDVIEIIRGVFLDVLALIDGRPDHVRVFFEFFRELPPELQATARARRDLYEALVEQTIRRGVETGVFRPMDPRTQAFALFGMCNWSYQWYRHDGRYDHREIAEMLCGIFVDGMRARP